VTELALGSGVVVTVGTGAAAASQSATDSNVSGSGNGGFISVRTFGNLDVPAGAVFSFTVPKDTFLHSDPKASVVLEARLANGKPLPDWLSFDAGTGRFTGKAPSGLKQIEVNVLARDSAGGEAATKIVLRFNGKSEVTR
jgi:large repetitive protein